MKRQGQMPILCVQFFSFSSSSLILLLSVISESFVLLAEPSNHRSLHSRLVRFSCRCFSSCNILKPFTSSNVYSDDFVCISSTYGCCWLPLFSLQWMVRRRHQRRRRGEEISWKIYRCIIIELEGKSLHLSLYTLNVPLYSFDCRCLCFCCVSEVWASLWET